MEQYIEHFDIQRHSKSSEVDFLSLRVALRVVQPGSIPDSMVIKHPQRSFGISPPFVLGNAVSTTNLPPALPNSTSPSVSCHHHRHNHNKLVVYPQSYSEPVSREGWGEEGGAKEGKGLEKHSDRHEKWWGRKKHFYTQIQSVIIHPPSHTRAPSRLIKPDHWKPATLPWWWTRKKNLGSVL